MTSFNSSNIRSCTSGCLPKTYIAQENVTELVSTPCKKGKNWIINFRLSLIFVHDLYVIYSYIIYTLTANMNVSTSSWISSSVKTVPFSDTSNNKSRRALLYFFPKETKRSPILTRQTNKCNMYIYEREQNYHKFRFCWRLPFVRYIT